MSAGQNQCDQKRLPIVESSGVGNPLQIAETRSFNVISTGYNRMDAGGYNWLSGFFAADQRFSVRIEQDVTNAPAAWGQGVTVAATLQPSGLWCVPIKQCIYGDFHRITLINTSGLLHTILRGVVYASPIEGSPVGSPSVSATVDLEDVETIHHNAANAIADGTDAVLDGSFSSGRIQITSTAGIIAATIEFYGSVDGVNFVPINCINTVTGIRANNTIIGGGANEIWEVETTGYTLLRAALAAINPAAGAETVTVVSKIIEGSTLDILATWDEGSRAKVNPIVGQAGVAGGAGATDATTQRVVLATDDLVVLATGANNGVSPGRSMLQGNQYNAVPPVGADGDMMPNQGNAYGHQEDAAFNRALGSEQITDISPVLLSRQPLTIRASAALAALGAYDTPIEIPTAGMGYLAIPCVYTRGLVGGGVRVRIEFADTVSGTDYWGRLPIVNAGVFASGTDAYDGIQRREFDYYATAVTAETFRIIVPLAGADKIRISCREIGVIGTPGTFAMFGKFSNQPIANQKAADSKAYTPATDSKRMEEISPLSQQYVTEQIVSSTTLTSASSPYYYPSSAGGLLDGYAHISFDWYILGNAAGPTTITLTVEGTDDAAWTTPQDITRAGYLVTNPAAGGVASYASVGAVANNGVLDFDYLNLKYWRVKLVVNAANNCTARIWARRRAL